MWYTRTVILLLVFALSVPTMAQITFNRRYGLGASNANFYSLAEVSDGYLVTGMKYDGSNHPFSVHLDFYGEVLEVHEFEYEGQYANLYESALQWTPEGELINVGHIRDDSLDFQSVIYWFDETGDTVRTRRDFSQFHLDDIQIQGTQGWYTPRDACQDDEGNIYELSAWGFPHGVVRKRDAEGNILWTHNFQIDGEASQMEIHNISWYDGIIYFNVVTGYWGGSGLSHLYLLYSDDGSLALEMELMDAARDQHRQIIPVNGGYLIAGRQNYPTELGSAPSVYELSDEGEVLWHRIFGDHDALFSKYCQEIIQTSETEYVCACPTIDLDPQDEIFYGNKNEMTAIVKFNEDGDILWEHKYTGFARPHDSHDLHDLIQTSDGGFAFCGVSGDWNEEHPDYEAPSVQGWLVKLDEFGCLEPGCQFLNIDQIAFDGEGTLEVYPNPSVGMINIRITGNHNSNDQRILVFDPTGKRVEEVQLQPGQQQFALNQLASGVYNVHLVIDNILIDSAKLVVR